jgi:hypothetical protein
MNGYSPPLIFGPIAPESNPPINPQYYLPNWFNIESIAMGFTTLVTTVIDHNYVVAQQVRLLIPSIYGANALNEQTAFVISIPSPNQMVLELFSLNSDTFVSNPNSGITQPQVVAIGDVNSGAINATGRTGNGTFIPGSFIDVSPA